MFWQIGGNFVESKVWFFLDEKDKFRHLFFECIWDSPIGEY